MQLPKSFWFFFYLFTVIDNVMHLSIFGFYLSAAAKAAESSPEENERRGGADMRPSQQKKAFPRKKNNKMLADKKIVRIFAPVHNK
jgi:hypothetical protein